MKVLNNLNQLEILIKELVEVLRVTSEENIALKLKLEEVEKERGEYETVMREVLKKVDDLIEEIEKMRR